MFVFYVEDKRANDHWLDEWSSNFGAN
uniref:Uncharacterized protein n=1 Tax=Rhizophora mucronata TaxID=61149 RepID=A0A2P2N7G1_RHIMU